MTDDLKVVDLGTKLGSAITQFRKKASMFFENIGEIKPEACLGIELQDKYRNDVEGQGYRFQVTDVTSEGALAALPEADYYLAWDFLEHLPTKAWSDAVVKTMLHKARKGVWCRMPSFEQDESTGEGALKQLGLRFAWTNWHGHPSHYLVEECVNAINEYKQEQNRGSLAVKVKPGRRVRATDDKSVVPIDSPIDTVKYEPKLGHRPFQKFDPPLVAQWEVVVTM
jgi:hypothetical protein